MPTQHKWPSHRQPGKYGPMALEECRKVLEMLNDVHKAFDSYQESKDQSKAHDVIHQMHELLDDAVCEMEEACLLQEDGSLYYAKPSGTVLSR
jgi:hypothetical protein